MPSLPTGLLNAFKFAEFVRRELVKGLYFLIHACNASVCNIADSSQLGALHMYWHAQVEARQKLIEAKEKEEDEEKKAKINEDAPGNVTSSGPRGEGHIRMRKKKNSS